MSHIDADDPAILRAFLDRAPDMIVLSDFSGELHYVNPAGRELLGLVDSVIDGLSTTDLFTPMGLDVAGEVEAALAGRGFWNGRTQLRHLYTGDAVAVELSVFVVERAEGMCTTPNAFAPCRSICGRHCKVMA